MDAGSPKETAKPKGTGWNMDNHFMAQPHKQQIQFDLLYD
jgi:hypothetical protein